MDLAFQVYMAKQKLGQKLGSGRELPIILMVFLFPCRGM